MSSFFNCILLSVCTGAVVSLSLVVWIQVNKGWDWGFGLSTFAMILAIIIFAVGLPLYRIQTVQKSSAIIKIIQVYVAAISKRDLQLPKDPKELYELDKDGEAALEAEFLPHTESFRFLDKAAMQTASLEQYGGAKGPNRWALCRVTQVENAKIILGTVPIFCCTIIMTLCLAQLQTFSIQQGQTMDTSITSSFHIPPASLPIIPFAFLIIIIPVYDQGFVPFARSSQATLLASRTCSALGLVWSCPLSRWQWLRLSRSSEKLWQGTATCSTRCLCSNLSQSVCSGCPSSTSFSGLQTRSHMWDSSSSSTLKRRRTSNRSQLASSGAPQHLDTSAAR